MSKLKIILYAIPFLILLVTGIVYFAGRNPKPRDEIVISIPYNEYIRNIDTNYYKTWLEGQTGLSIRFNIIHEPLTADYLRSMFSSGYVQSDAFFSILSGEDLAGFNSSLQEFGDKGYIIPLNNFIDHSVYLNVIFNKYKDYDLRGAITSPDGVIYYMPGLDPSMPESNFQVLWLNQDWLKKLKLSIPQTPEELRDVLYAFLTQDPNGNDQRDEIPLAGSYDIPSEQCFNFIINAFIYNDPVNSRLFMEDGVVRFAPVTDEWREAMKYLNGLFNDGLISPFQFTMDHDELAGLANDPWDILGGFTCSSITDVLFQSNPEIISNFVHVPPLAGPDGARRATVRTPLPKPAGVITSSCKHPEAVFKLFDLMLSEEAFLIGRFGEENVDWVPASVIDVDFYGHTAAIRVINQLRNTVQNKHICELGPFFAYPKYADSVTFSAFEVDQEYRDARAYRVYELYKPKEYVKSLLFESKFAKNMQTSRQAIDEYTDESIKAYITGAKDPFDDTVWALCLQKYQEMNIEELINAIQSAHDYTTIIS